jgi:hypothetical protein
VDGYLVHNEVAVHNAKNLCCGPVGTALRVRYPASVHRPPGWWHIGPGSGESARWFAGSSRFRPAQREAICPDLRLLLPDGYMVDGPPYLFFAVRRSIDLIGRPEGPGSAARLGRQTVQYGILRVPFEDAGNSPCIGMPTGTPDLPRNPDQPRS